MSESALAGLMNGPLLKGASSDASSEAREREAEGEQSGREQSGVRACESARVYRHLAFLPSSAMCAPCRRGSCGLPSKFVQRVVRMQLI